ncbi:MAG TPA: AMIN domain-containing protein [Terriglobales bacterium]|nr:AMIN domain-containing protein [Terriglobales bacterium]
MKHAPIAAKLAGFALAAALGSAASAQSEYAARTDQAATIRSIRALPSEDGWAVEVISTRPLVPTVSRAEKPPRLIIDLPHAHLSNLERRLAFQSSLIVAVRISQLHSTVARIVVDLVHPVRYSWDAAGNRLTIRVHPASSASQASSVAAITSVQPIGFLVAGVEVRVSGGTRASVIPSRSGRSLMLATSPGALKARYALAVSGARSEDASRAVFG